MQLLFENVLHLYINCKVLNSCELTHDQIFCMVGLVYEYFPGFSKLFWFLVFQLRYQRALEDLKTKNLSIQDSAKKYAEMQHRLVTLSLVSFWFYTV